MLLEEIKDLKKKLSELLQDKNKLYVERENKLLDFETRDKEQKIRYKRELAQQKAYYEEVIDNKNNEL